MDKAATLKSIQKRQWRWALSRGIAVVQNGRVNNFEDNFYSPFTPRPKRRLVRVMGANWVRLRMSANFTPSGRLLRWHVTCLTTGVNEPLLLCSRSEERRVGKE